MTTAVDTSVLLDLLTDDATHGPASVAALRTARAEGRLIACECVLAELRPALERAFYEEIIGDLCRTPPRLLLVEVAAPQSPAGRRALDLLSYYRQDARFERLFRAYDEVAVVAPFTVYKAARPLACTTMAPMLAFTP